MTGQPPDDGEHPWLRVVHDAEAAATADGASAGGFFRASSLAGMPVPERQWLVPGLIPAGTVTMLGGDGGVGKSWLALQLAVAVAAGRPWIGRECHGGSAVYLSAEDGQDELHRRLAGITETDGVPLADLDRLTVRSMAGDDALLAHFHPKAGRLLPTPLLHEIEEQVADERATMLELDTLADLHSGPENDRSVARQFIGMLRGVATRRDCTVVLLAHPSLTGMASGTGLSGSTAWSASVRSRLYLERIVDDGYEADPDRRRLTVKKANYGPLGAEIGLKWSGGGFVAEEPVSDTSLDRMANSAKAERVFLKLLRALSEQGRSVSPNSGHSYAPAIFAKHPGAEGCTSDALRRAMENLLTAGRIAVEEFGPPSRRITRLTMDCKNA